MVRFACFCSLIFALLTGSPPLLGQVGLEGSILGIVKDSTGAVIPGADVTAINLDTRLKKTSLTDGQGSFEILALPRGPYSVTITLPGFKTWRLERTELTVGERKRVSPLMEVGEVSEEVRVEAEVQLMQTEKASLEAVVEEKQIRELPLNGRNPVELVVLVPGMRYLAFNYNQTELGHYVQGSGNRADNTEFQLDGLNANAGVDETGIGIPNVDAVAEFNVETANFSAEHGRNPLQISIATKSGTNDFHGTLWEFHRNHKADAPHAFAPTDPLTEKRTTPKLIRNQFGFTLGGPIVKERTFFFASLEGTAVRQETIYNSTTISPEMLQGNFSQLSKKINDPLTKQPFPNNKLPESRFSSAAKFFFPYLLLPNSPGNRFKGVAPVPSDTYQYLLRLDHQITSKQSIYGRWVPADHEQDQNGYRPDIVSKVRIRQHVVGLNYNYAITPTTLFNLNAGYLRVFFTRNTPCCVGTENLAEKAGIQGFPTAGRDDAVGLPTVNLTGYTGFSTRPGDPYRVGSEGGGGSASMSLIRGQHSLSFGYRFDTRKGLGRHSSCCARGVFFFNGQYTGDAFADYLLGLVQRARRNYPLQTFGMSDAPYSSLYVQDYWNIHRDVTLNLGVRLDYWHEKAFVRGNGGTFDVRLGKAIAGEDKNGQVDLNAQPVARFLAKATESLWIPASQAGIPAGLSKADGTFSPRLGIAWRPRGDNDLVIRAGYGTFASSFIGNITASSIVGPPYWTFESQAWGRASLQRWESAWPDDPEAFLAPSVAAPAWDAKNQLTHEWNLSIQKSLPLDSAITVSYLGNRGEGLVTSRSHNDVPPGEYDDLDAARPWPIFGDIILYENVGSSWYDSLQVKWERRFAAGLSHQFAYAFSKHIDENGANIEDTPTPFSPKDYNRGRSQLDRTHILTINSIWEVPVGRGRRFVGDLHPAINAILGGWQLSGIYNFVSGTPLTFTAPGATLGNGWNTRPDLLGNPKLKNPSANLWFNPNALEGPPLYQFGNSGIGLLDGPGGHVLDLALIKNFFFTEDRYLQLRWEMFNAPNHVNLSNPVTTIGLGTTGKIFGAGAARQMQFGLKFLF